MLITLLTHPEVSTDTPVNAEQVMRISEVRTSFTAILVSPVPSVIDWDKITKPFLLNWSVLH